jgi:hypothetical protein
MVRSEEDAYPAGVGEDGGADLREPGPDRGGGRGQFGFLERQGFESLHEGASPAKSTRNQLARNLWPLVRGAEEIERGFLDPIFGFAPQTVEIVVESVGKQFEMADDEAGVLS